VARGSSFRRPVRRALEAHHGPVGHLAPVTRALTGARGGPAGMTGMPSGALNPAPSNVHGRCGARGASARSIIAARMKAGTDRCSMRAARRTCASSFELSRTVSLLSHWNPYSRFTTASPVDPKAKRPALTTPLLGVTVRVSAPHGARFARALSSTTFRRQGALSFLALFGRRGLTARRPHVRAHSRTQAALHDRVGAREL
jgi:hypothetical protein